MWRLTNTELVGCVLAVLWRVTPFHLQVTAQHPSKHQTINGQSYLSPVASEGHPAIAGLRIPIFKPHLVGSWQNLEHFETRPKTFK